MIPVSLALVVGLLYKTKTVTQKPNLR
jgi:hypothetical protein